jgi:hypothetical protein
MIVRDATTSINVPTDGDSNDKDRGFLNAGIKRLLLHPRIEITAWNKKRNNLCLSFEMSMGFGCVT